MSIPHTTAQRLSLTDLSRFRSYYGAIYLLPTINHIHIHIYKVEGPGGGVLQIREKENTAPEDALRVYKGRGLRGEG